MDGEAARALGDLARERWFRATWERTIPDAVETDPWPDGVEPDLLDTPIGIARTEPKWGGRGEVRENERLYLAAIREARSLIYLENQYFTSPVIARALADRLAEPDGPEIILVSTGKSPSWFDGITMDTARAEVLFRLEAADAHDRFLAFAPRSAGGERIIVHAKVAIFDDRMLRIGSTNLNNRSMGLDTECDVAMLPPTDAGRTAIRAFRHRSISHFIGITQRAYAEAEAEAGSTGRAIVSFGSDRMVPLGSDQPSLIEKTIAEWQLGDPKSSQDTWRPWKRRNPSQRIAHPRKA
jgi:phosphatidylserine/phosphatidylglycerophosphate/cardiolipin synthase-like enzyme